MMLFGLASSGLAAVAGHSTWATAPELRTLSLPDPPGDSPLAGALSLVVLACWGVLLVTRGGLRRVVAVAATLVAVGYVAVVVTGRSQVPEAMDRLVSTGGLRVDLTIEWSAWYYLALVGGVLAVVAGAMAIRTVPGWPEMGRRYDAPTGAASAAGASAEDSDATNLDLWKSLDAGHDPTA